MRQGFRNFSCFGNIFKPIVATGGIITDIMLDGFPWRVHTFLDAGASNFTVSSTGSSQNPAVEYLLVAGGGGGGYAGDRTGGGGGAGGLLTNVKTGSGLAITATTYSIVVGAGGSGGTSTAVATNGANTTAFGLSAIGGGRGGAVNNGALSGGSGGGSFHNYADSGKAGTSGQGNSGGAYGYDSGNTSIGFKASGGGGAGTAGQQPLDGNSLSTNGNGGSGLLSIIDGSVKYYAGGGGGGVQVYTTASSGGLGGGGAGGVNATTAPIAGTANTGGGGGGGSAANAGTILNGANGGSGIVVIRYPLQKAATFSTYPAAMSATGGTVTTSVVNGTRYKVHTFTSSGVFSVSSLGSLGGSIDYLIVGGGGGSAAGGPGGGAGGYITNVGGTKLQLSAEPYTIIVGTGGLGGTVTMKRVASGAGSTFQSLVLPANGGNSSAFGLTSLGGGASSDAYKYDAGGYVAYSGQGSSGGSGGGSVPSWNGSTYTSSAGGVALNSGTQGNPGGASGLISYGSGGGGAAAAGSTPLASPGPYGKGGDGLPNSISGPTVYYSGGGNGVYEYSLPLGGAKSIYVPSSDTTRYSASNFGAGGAGVLVTGEPSANNTVWTKYGMSGGPGVVIIRYPIEPEASSY